MSKFTRAHLPGASRSALRALSQADAALWWAFHEFGKAYERAEADFAATTAAIEATKAGGGLPHEEQVIAQNQARVISNRAQVAQELVVASGVVLEGSVDLDHTDITVAYTPAGGGEDA